MRIAIVGTTASGKSALGERIARELHSRGSAAEIVSADSMCVYRGMDVGTAKPTKADQRRWPTHGIDLVDPDQEFSVAQFQRYAVAVLKDIETRGAVAILVGGTGLYVDAVVNNLTMPPQFPEIKQSLNDELASGTPIENLYARLVGLDPGAAARMEPNNERRIIRALEVCVGSGRRFSSFGPGLVAAASGVGFADSSGAFGSTSASNPSGVPVLASPGWLLCGPTWARPELRERIAQRFSQQLVDGFVEEAANVLATYGEARSKTARQALGYRELWEHLVGDCSLPAAIDRAILRTGQFAVRQERWFRRDPRIHWIQGEMLEPRGFDHVSRADTESATEVAGRREVAQIVDLAMSPRSGLPVG